MPMKIIGILSRVRGLYFIPHTHPLRWAMLHGSQPDLLLLCHDPERLAIDDFEGYPIPALSDSIRRYEEAARLTNPAAKVAGISLITARIDANRADDICAQITESTGLPCFDPLKNAIDAIVLDLIA